MNKRLLLLLVLICACQKPAINDSEKIRELLAHQNLGLAYLEENQTQQAADEYSKIIELAPEEVLGYANLGLAKLRMQDYSEAEKRIKQALQKSDDPDAQLIL